ncbi:MAG: flagellar basal body rod protein FlgB [Bacteriovoracaceae bacterium]|jgi:flagellar basal-body rod protein FlgB|nr:flagellar basal body rod protein FlgB [Bacteriovoracaceae bacterium]
MKIADKTMKALATSLNMRELRQELIASNIANATTPGYKAKRIEFEGALKQALDLDKSRSMNVNNPNHFNVGGGGFESVQPEIFEDPNGIASQDGNTVDRDAEMAKMAENKIMYDAAVQLLNKKIALMKYTLNSN